MVRYLEVPRYRPYGFILEMSRTVGHEFSLYTLRSTPVDDGMRSVLSRCIGKCKNPFVVGVIGSKHQDILASIRAWSNLNVVALQEIVWRFSVYGRTKGAGYLSSPTMYRK